MKDHVKNYLKAKGLYHPNAIEPPFIPCEDCGAPAVDIHHKRGRRIPDADHIENLEALCRQHHADRHNVRIADGGEW